MVAAAGFGSQRSILEYDHLVIALGNVTSFAGQPGLAEHALPFKYLGDALALRNRSSTRSRRPTSRTIPRCAGPPDLRGRPAGLLGVEAIAELNDFV